MADPSEQIVGVLFPLQGIDATCEYGRQPSDTTPSGVNVRSFEVIDDRARGGSRCGLSKYINEQVNGVTSPVWHLNILVDPQDPSRNGPVKITAGTGADEPNFLPRVPDPSTNNLIVRNFGRYVIAGGSGRVPFRVRPPVVAFRVRFTAKSQDDSFIFMDSVDDGMVVYGLQVVGVESFNPAVPPLFGLSYLVVSSPDFSGLSSLPNGAIVTVVTMDLTETTPTPDGSSVYNGSNLQGA